MGTVHSATWSHAYSPDLCWVTSLNGHPQPALCVVLDNFSHSRHRPSLIPDSCRLLETLGKDDGISGKLIGRHSVKLWNEVPLSSHHIPSQSMKPTTISTESSSRQPVCPGYRLVYIPCLDAICSELLKLYNCLEIQILLTT